MRNVLCLKVFSQVLRQVGLQEIESLFKSLCDYFRHLTLVFSEIQTVSLIEVVHKLDVHKVNPIAILLRKEGNVVIS